MKKNIIYLYLNFLYLNNIKNSRLIMKDKEYKLDESLGEDE